MPRRCLKLGALLLTTPALLAIPALSFAGFETVETIPFPSRGEFPAYPGDPTLTRPTTTYLQAGVLYDSNPFRLAEGLSSRAFLGKDQRSDTIVRVGAGITHEQRVFGRQSVFLAARGDYFDYMRYDTMNNFAYGLLGEWRWELGNDLSGTIGYDRTKRAMAPGETLRPVLNTITAQRLFANAAYRLGPMFRLRGGLDGIDSTREGPGRDRVDIQSHTAYAGLDLVSSLGNTLGIEGRHTDGEAPIPIPLLDVLVDPTATAGVAQYDEREVAAVATYALGTQLAFDGRIGHTHRHYKDIPIPDFDGTTYRAGLRWTPGNKTIVGAEVYRAPRTILDINATDALIRGVAGTLSWAPTIKLVFTGRYAIERRTFTGDPTAAAVGLSAREDTGHTLRFGVGWEPRRFIELSAGAEYGTRDSNILFRDYNYKAVMINGAVRW